MKFVKSKCGYFYKVYKNGKKKRISKEQYLKYSKKKITNKQKTHKTKNMRGGDLKKGDIVRVTKNIEDGVNTISAHTLGTVYSNQLAYNSPFACIINFHPNKNQIFLETTNVTDKLEILLATTYIEQYLEPKLRYIIIESYFWKEWMKPLLELKKVRVKSLQPLKFSSIREPLFTSNPGEGFQETLMKWWNIVSQNFTMVAEHYCLMKHNVNKELIVSRLTTNNPQHDSDYFYLQFPVMFINRLLQIIEYYNEILSKNNKLANYHIKKENVLSNTKNNKLVNYYKADKKEHNPVNIYRKQELDKFREIFQTLKIFCQSDGLYKNLLAVELSFLKWYNKIVSFDKGTSRTTGRSAFGFTGNDIEKHLTEHFRLSYDKKYIFFPISMDPAEKYMLNMYCIPIICYLSKLVTVHIDKIGHPMDQILHDFAHMSFYIYENIILSKDVDQLKSVLNLRYNIVKDILGYKDNKSNFDVLLFEFFHEQGHQMHYLFSRFRPEMREANLYLDKDKLPFDVKSYSVETSKEEGEFKDGKLFNISENSNGEILFGLRMNPIVMYYIILYFNNKSETFVTEEGATKRFKGLNINENDIFSKNTINKFLEIYKLSIEKCLGSKLPEGLEIVEFDKPVPDNYVLVIDEEGRDRANLGLFLI
jgi:hypothetical protein